MERREELAELLTDKECRRAQASRQPGGWATLRFGNSPETSAWGPAATGSSLPWPAPEALLLKFFAQCDGSRSGIPDDVDKNLRLQNALDTVHRRRPAGRPSRNGTVLAALSRGELRAGAWGVFRSRTSVRIPDGGGRSRHSPPRGNGAVAPSIASANEQLLQQRNEAERPGCTHVV